MLKFFLKMSVLFSMMFFIGCSSKVREVSIIIPPPPEEPKIFFDTLYYGDASFADRNLLDNFIGEEVSFGNKNLAKPYGVAAIGNKIYVSDTAYGAVFKIDEIKKEVSLLGSGSSGKLALPVGIAIDDYGKIYVADAKAAQILVYDRNEKLISVYGGDKEFVRPTGIAINNKERKLYVVDTKAHNIHIYSLDGKKLSSFGKRGIKEGEFNYPTNIAIDKRNGNLVVVDTQNFRIQIFDKEGNFLRKFGEIGDKAGMFARPKGVGVDSDGNIYVADAAFNNIQVFNDKGELLIFFGSTGTQEGRFSLIAGIYIDENDRIFVVDGFNARVQIYQYVSDTWKRKHPQEYLELKESE